MCASETFGKNDLAEIEACAFGNLPGHFSLRTVRERSVEKRYAAPKRRAGGPSQGLTARRFMMGEMGDPRYVRVNEEVNVFRQNDRIAGRNPKSRIEIG